MTAGGFRPHTPGDARVRPKTASSAERPAGFTPRSANPVHKVSNHKSLFQNRFVAMPLSYGSCNALEATEPDGTVTFILGCRQLYKYTFIF